MFEKEQAIFSIKINSEFQNCYYCYDNSLDSRKITDLKPQYKEYKFKNVPHGLKNCKSKEKSERAQA